MCAENGPVGLAVLIESEPLIGVLHDRAEAGEVVLEIVDGRHFYSMQDVYSSCRLM